MKVLNLIIKQKFFDAILKGTKTQEFREVKPTTIKKLLQLDDDGFEVEDEYGNSQPLKYDAIRFFVGYNKDRDSALVEVKNAYCEVFTETVWYKGDEDGNVLLFKANEDGDFVLDENGNLIEDEEDGKPYEVEEGSELAVATEMPIEYEYNKQLWVAEQVVFDLGKVLEKDVHPKAK